MKSARLEHMDAWAPTVYERRGFLRHVAGATAAALGGAWLGLGTGCRTGNTEPQRRADPGPRVGESGFRADVEIALRAVRAKAQLFPGEASEVWTFHGRVERGSANALDDMPSGALGPTFHVRRGQRLRIVFENEIPEPSIVHWHGLSVPEAMDGHPRFAIGQGQRYVYEFEVKNPAGTYWYHAHPDMRTGPQIYRGMAGLFLVHDAEEDRLLLPRDELDVPLVIQDRLFDRDNQLVYAPSPMHDMQGWLGDRVLVNGVRDYTRRVSTRAYRLRIMNGSNSRIYRLAWADATPLTVIGTDGGLLERAVERPYVMLGPAERLELWVDFSTRALGSELALVSLAFEAGEGMGMGMGQRSPAPRQGAPMAVLTLKVEEHSKERMPLPATLIPMSRYREADASNVAAPRRIVPTLEHMRWGMNGRTFELDQVAPDERVRLDTLEIWNFDNSGSDGPTPMGRGPRGMGRRGRGGGVGMSMAMPHPMHLHGGQFQILGRTGVTHAGYVDEGWKDTVLVMPGEQARILMRYSNYPGLYLYHCHNLEHEDAGMMRNFLVEA